MKKVYRGRFNAKNKKIGIVVAKFNDFITKRLLDSALECFDQAGVVEKNIEVVWVPGALEIPQFCKKLSKKKLDGILALGCVIRGETYHFECVALETTRGTSQVALESEVPIATAILTVENLEQAIDRAGLKAGNKGGGAALALLEMMDLDRQLKKG